MGCSDISHQKALQSGQPAGSRKAQASSNVSRSVSNDVWMTVASRSWCGTRLVVAVHGRGPSSRREASNPSRSPSSSIPSHHASSASSDSPGGGSRVVIRFSSPWARSSPAPPPNVWKLSAWRAIWARSEAGSRSSGKACAAAATAIRRRARIRPSGGISASCLSASTASDANGYGPSSTRLDSVHRSNSSNHRVAGSRYAVRSVPTSARREVFSSPWTTRSMAP